ncbi:MAG: hypothetical protein JWR77_2654 [Rhizorhabdus sp.]|nr:hypothetical protein [Rhizorhabdus sp.]
MSRKHKPLLVGGREVEITGQGFRIIMRLNGARDAYWLLRNAQPIPASKRRPCGWHWRRCRSISAPAPW